MPSQPAIDPHLIGRFLIIELTRATERAAAAAAGLRGHGDEMAADMAAVAAMHAQLADLPAHGRVVIGEGDGGCFRFGEMLGSAVAPRIDLAVAPLEGATLCAKDMAGAVSVAAAAAEGALLNAPDVYMDKIAIGPGYPEGLVDLDRSPHDNIAALAAERGVSPADIAVCILDRPRHADLIAKCRRAGARVRLISDGDIAGVIVTADRETTGVDMYLGRGGAPEGVLAAAALACVGGQMQARLALDSPEQRARAASHGIADPDQKYALRDMVRGDVVVCVTGVTDGPLAGGVVFGKGYVETETIAYRSATRTVRRIRARRPVDFG